MKKKKEKLTIEIIQMQKIIWNYYKQLYTNIMDNPVEMDKYPEMCNHPRLNQEETKYE